MRESASLSSASVEVPTSWNHESSINFSFSSSHLKNLHSTEQGDDVSGRCQEDDPALLVDRIRSEETLHTPLQTARPVSLVFAGSLVAY
jgi:hypothetical protein